MSTSRWWIVPLCLAVLVDGLLVARYETSAGLFVSRAVLRTASSNSCEQSMLVRVPDVDYLNITDTWVQDGHVMQVPASQLAFGPDGSLTPQAKAEITEGIEVDTSGLANPQPASAADPLVQPYKQQLKAGDSWLRGACVTLSNPLQGHLHKVGSVVADDQSFIVYEGGVRHGHGGFVPFDSASVWIGLRTDGRVGFEVLSHVSTAESPISAVVTLFGYPQTHLGSTFATEPAQQREAFYTGQYDAILDTITQVEGAKAAARPASPGPGEASGSAQVPDA